MPDGAAWDEWEVTRRHALLDVERMLKALPNADVRSLAEHEIRGTYLSRSFDAGWRLRVVFSDGIARRLDVVAPSAFPTVPVRTALVDRPEYLTWPHIEHDGILCVLTNASEIDPDRPAAVSGHVLNRSIRLVEDLIDGAIVERDFREEFLTYWFYGASDQDRDIVTLFQPGSPSRLLQGCRYEGITYIAEDGTKLAEWLGNRFGSKVAHRVVKDMHPVAYLWLAQPPLPKVYPRSGFDLMAIAGAATGDGPDLLREAAFHDGETVTALIGAEGRGGAGIASVQVRRGMVPGAPGRPRGSRLSKGHRPQRMPANVKVDLTYGSNKVRRSLVERADAAWIHGRGQNPSSQVLFSRSVTLFGLGSIGSFVAEHLARSGVGTLRLVDYDVLNWANVGRHVLGARSVGKNKATELACELRQNFPHLSISGFDQSAEFVVASEDDALLGSNLLISMMGNWPAESQLNRWHHASERKPNVLYGWAEDRAMSGSTVVIAGTGGCLRCGLDHLGRPHETATLWAEDQSINTEPACSDRFQPYGAIELSSITNLVAQTALRELLAPSNESYRMLSVAGKEQLKQLGATESATVPRPTDDSVENFSFRTSWEQCSCPHCGN